MPDQDGPTEPDRDGDRDELVAFLYGLRALLGAIVEDGRWIPKAQAENVQRAWDRVQTQFAALIKSINALPGTDVPSKDWEPLDQRGLSGPGLRLELQGFWGRMFAFGRRMNRPWVRSMFRWANTILGSLAAVFPPADAIKEFKESLENLIEDSAADARWDKRRERKRRRNTGA